MVGPARTARIAQTRTVARTATAVGMTVVGVVVLGLLAAACSSGGGESGTDTTPDTAPVTSSTTNWTTTTAPTQTEEAAILAAVETFWRLTIIASSPPDPSATPFNGVATGEALDIAMANVSRRHQLGQSVILPEPSIFEHRPMVRLVNGDTAVVDDCAVDDSILIDLATGSVLNDLVQTTKWETTLRRVDGVWLVASNLAVDGWDGVAGCAA